MVAQPNQEPESKSTGTTAEAPVRRRFRMPVVLGFTVVLAATGWALVQPPRSATMPTPTWRDADFWLYPIERNAVQRLTVVPGELHGLAVPNGTADIWIVGDGGLVARSRDNGRHWDQRNLSAPIRRQLSPRAAASNRLPITTPEEVTGAPPVRLASFIRNDAPDEGGSSVARSRNARAQRAVGSRLQGAPVQAQQQRPRTTVPAVVGMDFALAVKTLAGADLRVGRTDSVAAPPRSVGRVVSQEPNAGQQAYPGDPVNLQIGRRSPSARQQVQQASPPAANATPAQTQVPTVDSAATPEDTTSFYPRLLAICFGDARRGWIIGQAGVVFQTSDSGTTWSPVPPAPAGARGNSPPEFTGIACSATGGALAATDDETVVVFDSARAVARTGVKGVTATAFRDDSTWLTLSSGVVRSFSYPPRSSFPDYSTEGGVQLIATANGAIFAGASDAMYFLPRRATEWRRADCANVSVPVPAGDSNALRRVFSARAIHGFNDKSVMAIDVVDRVWTTADGWATCQLHPRWGSAGTSTARPVLGATGLTNWFLVAGGHLYGSRDAGRSWHSVITPSRFQSLAFADSVHGWAGTEDGHVARTSDGGRTWLVSDVDVDPPGAVLHLTARTRRDVFALTRRGAYGSADGGVHWSELGLAHGDTTLHSLAFADSAHGWGAALDTIFETRDGGNHWTRTSGPRQLQTLRMSVRAVASRPDSAPRRNAAVDSAIAVGGARPTADSSNAGLLWWFVDDAHHLSRYEADGTWTPIDTSVHLRAAVPVSATLGFALDSLGSLLQSTSGGTAWTAVGATPGRTWPAPWFFAMLPLAVLATAVAARRPAQKQPDPEKTIADILVSDRPVRSAAEDVLDFGTIAGGLSRFLQNPRTQPPITIAVEGQWGTGKSSLMNMVRAELVEQGFPTVWFNAWHHQREEALLAAMLESIRLNATPPLWTLRGVRFRLRLIFARFPKYAVSLVVLIPLFAYALGYVLKDPTRTLHDLAAAFWGLAKIFGATPPAGVLSDNAPKTTFLVVVSIVGTAITYLRGLKAFGVDPTSVAKSAMAAGRVRAPQSQPAFRARFAQDFRQVTDALKPRRLVIFIDDLDRCKPDQVLEILEAVNFLVDSGDCVVILGIDRDRVTGCVAIGFKEVAGVLTNLEEIRRQRKPAEADDVTRRAAAKLALVNTLMMGETDVPATPVVPPKPVGDAERQLEYASRYLDKLINMEIPIPVATAQAIGNVLTNSRTDAPDLDPVRPSENGGVDAQQKKTTKQPPREPLVQRLRRYKRPTQMVVTVVIAVVLFLVGFRGSMRFWRNEDAPIATLGVRTDVPQAPPNQGPPITTDTTRSTTGDASNGMPLQRTALNLIEGSVPSRSWWQHAVFFGASVLLLLWLVTPRVASRVDDSDAFTQALRAWSPVLFQKFDTPRSAKKFLNQVRFLAMAQRTRAPLQRPVEELVDTVLRWSLVRRVRDALGAWRSRDVEWRPGEVPDVSLVTLRVIAERYPAWLDDPAFWEADIGAYARSKRGGTLPKELEDTAAMAESLRRQRKVPEDFNPFTAHHGFRDSWRRLRAWTRDD